MTRKQNIYIWAIAVAGAVGGACVIFRPAHTAFATTEPADSDKPVAFVQVTSIRTGDITKNLTVYGSVTAAPDAIASVSSPIESRVVSLRASAGQSVQKGALLLEVEPSPDTKLQLLDARNSLEAAKKNLADTQQRFDLKLATNSDLLQVQQSVQAAALKLDDLQKRGAGEDVRKITADADSVVSKINVQGGQLVPAGGTLIELVARGKIEISVGVEPSEANALRADQVVRVFPTVATAEGISGRIRLVTDHINPASRLVEVFVTPDSKGPLLLDDFVRADLKIETQQAMIVPRSAVLPDEDGVSIFIVKNNLAIKKPVKVTLQNEQDAAIVGEDLHDGDPVVVQGNLELEDGMDVSVEASK